MPKFLAAFLALSFFSQAHAQVERVWLTHQSATPGQIVVNWETSSPTRSVLRFGKSSTYEQTLELKDLKTRHQVEIPIKDKDVVWHYSVGEGADATPDATFKGYPNEELRIAIVADWGYAPGRDFSALKKDDVHLLITAGDNVASLHEKGLEGAKAYQALLDAHAEIFRSTPFMPILGNHDKETKPRGPKPPAEAVYDVNATVYREFFALPGDEWKWDFTIPEFGVHFLALDIQHISDFGNTWQTCHPFDKDSAQFIWLRDRMAKTKAPFVFSLINEKQSNLNGQTKGLWHEEFCKGSALISGFGYFAERAELKDSLPYFNTCLKGDGSVYKDPQSQFLASEDNYLLLTFKRGADTMTVQFKNLKGDVLDSRVIRRG